MSLDAMFNQKATEFENYFATLFSSNELEKYEGIAKLLESVRYSCHGKGKRFRPVLALLIADLFDCKHQKVLAFAAAIEMIHTYSLIHDDLPCMDNDETRRGQPTNHVVFGEDFALLAGDSLLTEAFGLLARSYRNDPELALSLVELLSQKSGIQGMIGGQAIDLIAQQSGLKKETLQTMHELKTASLIQCSAVGAAMISKASQAEIERISIFGQLLGINFQITDDILDFDQNEKGSFPGVFGIEESKLMLKEASLRSIELLKSFRGTTGFLHQIVEYNLARTY